VWTDGVKGTLQRSMGFKLCLNEEMDGGARTEMGEEFHTLGAVELKAQPHMTVRVLG
jgi:hypothetical protein